MPNSMQPSTAFYGSGGFPADPSYYPDLQQLQRKQALADMLRQQALNPIPQETVSGRVVPFAPTQGLAQLAQAFMARRLMDQGDESSRALATRMQGERDSDLEAAMGAANPQARALRLARSLNPGLQAAGLKMMEKLGEGQFAKINPKDFTADSVKTFATSGNYSDLVPVRPLTPLDAKGPTGAPVTTFRNLYEPQQDIEKPVKMEMVPAGGTTQPTNPYTQTAPIQHTMTPGEQGRLGFEQYKLQNVDIPFRRAELANQGLGLGMRRAELGFNTGLGPQGGGAMPAPPAPMPNFAGGPVPQAPAVPQAAPMPQIAPPGPNPGPQASAGTVPRVGQPAAPSVAPAASGAPVAAPGGLTPRGAAEIAQKREEERPAATQALSSINTFTDGVLKDIDHLLKDPGGVRGITGPVFGRLPSIKGSSTNAQTRLDALKAKLSIQSLNEMRAASKTGGAVGQVTEKEWPRLESMYAALGESATTDEFVSRLKEIQNTIGQIKQNAGIAYNMAYGRREADKKSVLDQADAILRGGR